VAAIEIFLKLTDIEGESVNARHPKEIDVVSFSWGISQASAATANTTSGKALFQDLRITKRLDKASARLSLACAQATHIKEGVLTVVKSGTTPVEFYQYQLGDLVVTSVEIGSGGGDAGLPQSVTFSYGRIIETYQPVDNAGAPTLPKVQFKWNVTENKTFV
jgi:type VI secretion system secreted protein Hcp